MSTSFLLLLHRIKNRRFDDKTLQVLNWNLVSKDVKSSLEARSSLRETLRNESLPAIRDAVHKTVEEKLLILEFFIQAFALIGDVESCLALKYEGLLLREVKCGTCHWLQVSHTEWINFSHQALHYGFYSIAKLSCEKALVCFQKKDFVDEESLTVQNMKRLRDHSVKLLDSGCVQAQAAEYLKKKLLAKRKNPCSSAGETKSVASSLFRDGIKKRNVQKLIEHQRMQQNNVL
ncbi:hypothetical protein K2173_016409 [Erythroxylum novogranatense]|uniref:Uncharacterized protein n=1 Tax=Erythroxylum novogranatense TaxID=1862640 RepID=A0AAV8SGD9_9ROSI|nr:hypothetical protein K2173_016409 [Erythroxylum novogranatense]